MDLSGRTNKIKFIDVMQMYLNREEGGRCFIDNLMTKQESANFSCSMDLVSIDSTR